MSQDSARNDKLVERQHLELERVQRRCLWLSVMLPFLVVLIICIAVFGVALSLRTPVQVALVSDSVLTVLVLLPMAICLFPIVILSLALVALASRWHARSRSPLRRLEMWTAAMEQNVEAWLGHVDGRVLNWAVRLAPVRQMLRMFDPPAIETQEEGDE